MMRKLRAFNNLFRAARTDLKNWPTALLGFMFGLSIDAKFVSGETYRCNTKKLLRQLVRYRRISNNPIIIKDEYVFVEWFGSFLKIPLSYFIDREVLLPPEIATEYNVDVRDKTVLDVGAYIGDSALFFLSRGAKKVVAVEPVPEHFEILKINSVGRPIECINAAVGHPVPNDPKLIGSSTYGLMGSPELYGDFLEVPVLSLKDIVKEKNPDVVKIDTEGAEYFMFEDLVRLGDWGVETLVMEIHQFKVNRLVKPDDYYSFRASLLEHLGEPIYTIRRNRVEIIAWKLHHNIDGKLLHD